ncbi:hypothetical protein MHYP_G00029260 [Metynnis hypsauchen]
MTPGGTKVVLLAVRAPCHAVPAWAVASALSNRALTAAWDTAPSVPRATLPCFEWTAFSFVSTIKTQGKNTMKAADKAIVAKSFGKWQSSSQRSRTMEKPDEPSEGTEEASCSSSTCKSFPCLGICSSLLVLSHCLGLISQLVPKQCLQWVTRFVRFSKVCHSSGEACFHAWLSALHK